VRHEDSECAACSASASTCGYNYDCDFRDETGQYVLKDGHDKELRLYVRVKNSGEDAHETVVTLTLPPFMEYRGVDSAVSKITAGNTPFLRYHALASASAKSAVLRFNSVCCFELTTTVDDHFIVASENYACLTPQNGVELTTAEMSSSV
jgi:hypothetical protein